MEWSIINRTDSDVFPDENRHWGQFYYKAALSWRKSHHGRKNIVYQLSAGDDIIFHMDDIFLLGYFK